MSLPLPITTLSRWGAVFLLPALLGGGCVYDASDRCGPSQEISPVGACVCLAGLVLKGTACEPCPAHETEQEGLCVCDSGYERLAEGQACEAIIEVGLGTSCSSSKPCADPLFNTCRTGSAAGDYCTREGCATSEDCDSGYACNTRGPTTFCERPPVGQGTACLSNDDCAGTDASFCDSYVSKACLVPDCSLELSDCFEGWECCDLSGFPLPGVPKTLCGPAGQCPQ